MVWNALRDLCGRRGIDFHSCKEKIIELREGVSVLDKDSKTMIRMDLVYVMLVGQTTNVCDG